ncbi:hypothetical protein Enr10x_04510 [Gimesia panareensis]|uniref:Uncharacterized protein n=1 Tax=Gimesia panareensis TaxID=2527978 RepID=A0A517Q0Q4_9PLAN|nr:hypothetical protein Enr10x_04510 [Gimesia panareensis]
MTRSFHQEHVEFAQHVRTTCHRLNNFLTILQCQHEHLAGLPSSQLEPELAVALQDLEPLVDTAANDVLELSKQCRDFLEGVKQPGTSQKLD